MLPEVKLREPGMKKKKGKYLGKYTRLFFPFEFFKIYCKVERKKFNNSWVFSMNKYNTQQNYNTNEGGEKALYRGNINTFHLKWQNSEAK